MRKYDKTPLPVTWTHACGFREVVCGKKTADTKRYCRVHKIWTEAPCHQCPPCKACRRARRAFRLLLGLAAVLAFSCASSPPAPECPRYEHKPEIVDPFVEAPAAPPDGGVCGEKCVPLVENYDGGPDPNDPFARVF